MGSAQALLEPKKILSFKTVSLKRRQPEKAASKFSLINL